MTDMTQAIAQTRSFDFTMTFSRAASFLKCRLSLGCLICRSTGAVFLAMLVEPIECMGPTRRPECNHGDDQGQQQRCDHHLNHAETGSVLGDKPARNGAARNQKPANDPTDHASLPPVSYWAARGASATDGSAPAGDSTASRGRTDGRSFSRIAWNIT